MIYLGNGIWSDSGPSLSHGGPWKDHKYIAIKNGRYIYPDDGGKQTKPKKFIGWETNNNSSSAQNARKQKSIQDFESKFGYSYKPKAPTPTTGPVSLFTPHPKDLPVGYTYEEDFSNGNSGYKPEKWKVVQDPKTWEQKWALMTPEKDYYNNEKITAKNVTNASNAKVKYKYKSYLKQKEAKKGHGNGKQNAAAKMNNATNSVTGNLNAYKAKYGEMGKANGGPSVAELVQNKKAYKAQYGEMGKANGGPSAAQKAQTTPYGHSKNTSTGSKTVQYKKKLEDTNYKYQKAVSSQGPSAAQKAQSYAKDGYSETSKNVGVGTKKVTYSESKYNKSVTNQGPSAAQKAQSYNKAGISTKSKNVNSGSKKVNYEHADYGPKKKKKKVSFKKAIEWIKGAPGKVSVKK